MSSQPRRRRRPLPATTGITAGCAAPVGGSVASSPVMPPALAAQACPDQPDGTVVGEHSPLVSDCRDKDPLTEELADRAAAAGAQRAVLRLATQDTAAAAGRCAVDAGVLPPAAMDTEGQLSRAVRQIGAPRASLLRADGSVAQAEVGAVASVDALREVVTTPGRELIGRLAGTYARARCVN